jgi:hypothetical protein
MIYDKQLLFSKNQAITATAASTDIADLSPNGQYGPGYPVFVKAIVGTTFTAGGAATLTVALQDSADGSTGWADVVSSGAIGKANLINGTEITLALPEKHRRYLRVNYVVATGPMTAGTVSAAMTASR